MAGNRIAVGNSAQAVVYAVVAFFYGDAVSVGFAVETKPNVVFILADDLGYGDL